jgi:agmatine deiminase
MALIPAAAGADGAEGDGWHVPAEDAPHARTFLQWPASRAIYPRAAWLAEAQAAILRLARAIAAFEPVVLLAAAAHHPGLRPRLPARVALWDVPTDDLWARDSGPLFVIDGRGGLAIRAIRFNGWGGKQTHAADGQVAARVAARMGLALLPAGLTGEPGGVETDGAGTLIAHESSWVDPARNPGLDRDVIGARLCAAYGARRILWAPGLRGRDITDFHIDALARFAAPGRVLFQMQPEGPPGDPWQRAAAETRTMLEDARDAAGRRLQLAAIAAPRRPRVQAAEFLASYVNFHVCNGAVIAQHFGDRDADAAAQAVLAAAFPGREIVPLDMDALGRLGGGIHCATQQQPAV